jgi:hypothetical protein
VTVPIFRRLTSPLWSKILHRSCPRVRLSCSQPRPSNFGGANPYTGLAGQRFGVILAAKDCATIFPSRTTNVSVAASYELSAVSALHKM